MFRPIPAAILTALAAPAIAQPAPRATIDTGALVGTHEAGVEAFRGIPFAAPPVGPLRWRAPQPLARWAGPRDATRYGSDCMQLPFPSDAAPLGTPPAEDCLYANVWRPAGAKRRLPVMVWIYGGGYVNGGSSPPTYAGAALARHGILVVSFNYRLGRFGAFAHPLLTRADADHGLLVNYGFLDQLAALRWVRRNAAAFGGDPAQVTVVGESAGGRSVHMLVTSPMARGLFHRAVVQSGGIGALDTATLADAEATGLAFARSQGIADADPAALDRLRALPATAIVGGLNLAAPAPATYGGPIADGRIAVDALAAYLAGQFAPVPMMIGATSDDIGGAQGVMVTGAREIAGLVAGRGAPTWYYRFSYVADAMRASSPRGAGHATDIPFFFDTADVKYGAATTARDRAAARLASGYLVNFVKRGDPNGAELPRWPDHRAAPATLLDLAADGGARVVPDR